MRGLGSFWGTDVILFLPRPWMCGPLESRYTALSMAR